MRVDTARKRAPKGGDIAFQRECSFCQLMVAQADGGSREIWDTVLFESDNFVVVPTLGAFIEGWVLIVSKEHYLCVGAMPRALHGELEAVTAKVTAAIRHVYGAPTVFEHGPSRDGQSIGCGVDHAHLHAAALPFSLTSVLRRSAQFAKLTWNLAHGRFSDLGMLHTAGQAYVFVEEADALMRYCTPVGLPCQAVRRVMAREMDIEQRYDYHEYSCATTVKQTIDRLAGCF